MPGSRGVLHRFTRTKNLTWLIVLLPLHAPAGVVLLYHHVNTSTPPITSITPAQFDKHLEIIEAEAFTVLPLEQLVENSQKGVLDGKEVAITFDDAYFSIYTEAFPRLRARKWPFTIFVAPSHIGNGKLYLTWDQLKEMSEAGAAIENHTMTHTHMIRLMNEETRAVWRQRMLDEIQTASALLTQHDFVSRHFAYPYGEYNLELLAIIESLGLTGYGQQSGAIGPLSDTRLLPRFPLSGGYVGESAFRDKLKSLSLPVKPAIVEPLVEQDYKPKLLLAFEDESVALDRLTCYGPGGLMNLTLNNRTVTATPLNEVPVGRSRYNCTLPQGSRYYWISQLWLRKRADGTWYPEP